jgi:iron complex outermembrane recepter protein
MTKKNAGPANAGLKVAGLALVLVNPAWGQDGGGSEIGEIVVTARRVAENLQSTPVSVQAFDDAALKASAVADLSEITRIAPGVRFQGQGNIAYTEITMRGLGQTPVGTSGPAVQVYFSEVPLTVVTNLPAFDLASVQVLRGPQGTLFGRNTIGGAVLISPQQPTFNTEGYASIAYGSFDYRALEGAVNLPVNDTLALRVAAQSRRRDGYVRNRGVGGDFGDIDQDSVRASLLFEPIEGLTNTTVATYFQRDENGPVSVPYEANPNQAFYPLLSGLITEALALGRHKTNNDQPNVFLENEDWAAFNTTTYELSSAVKLKNVFGYQHTDQGIGMSADGLPVPLFDPIRLTNFKTISNEFQVLGTGFSDRLEWILGGFYSETRPGGNNTVSVFGTNISTYLKNWNEAAYLNGSYDLTDKFRLNAGVRYSWDEQRACYLVTGGGLPNVPSAAECEDSAAAASTPNGQGIARTKGDAPTWTIGLDYQASDSLFFYVTSRRGYRSGGLNSPLYNTPCTTGDPACDNPATPAANDGTAIDLRSFQAIDNEKLTDVEIGMRSEPSIGGRKHRVNVTGFRYIHDNVAGLLPVSCQSGAVGCPADPSIGYNSGRVRGQGLELDLAFNLSDALSFNLNGAYTEQKQTRAAVSPAGFTGVIPPANFAAPKWAGTAYVDYLLPIRPAASDVNLHLEYFRTSKYQAQNFYVPGYGLANATLRWSNIAGSGTDVSLWARNILDEEYIIAPVVVDPNQFPVKAADFGEPAAVGIEVLYHFGG